MNLNNIFNFKKNQEELSDEEKRKKALTTLLIYGAFFALIIVFSLISPKDNSNNQKQIIDKKEDMSSLYESISKDNFDGQISIIGDADIILVDIFRDNIDKELLSKTYREKVYNYLRIGNNYYEVNLDNKTYKKENNIKIYNNYDTTFLNISNILKLIDGIEKTDIQEESYNIARYKTNLSKALNIYNEINKTNYTAEEDSEIIIDINYSENIEKIIIDMTKIHNIIKKTTYNKLMYTITFNSIGEIDLSSIKEEDIN